MSESKSITAQFRQMPRALKWGSVAIVLIAMFVIWDSAISDVVERWNKEAGIIETNIQKIRAAELKVRELQAKESVVRAIGPVRVPQLSADGLKMLDDVVLDVLQKHGAIGATFSSRTSSKLGKTVLVEVTQGRWRIERVTGEIKFDATPKAAAAIIADLESSPHIEAISNVRINKDTGGRVKVTLTVESWMKAAETA